MATTSSVIQAAGVAAGGTKASPKTLVELVRTKLFTPWRSAASSKFRVPLILVSINACGLCVATCGLCKVAVCSTASMPRMAAVTAAASPIEHCTLVKGEAAQSKPMAWCSPPCKVRISASPKCPALPVTRILITHRKRCFCWPCDNKTVGATPENFHCASFWHVCESALHSCPHKRAMKPERHSALQPGLRYRPIIDAIQIK
jgi:hypothetical protein